MNLWATLHYPLLWRRHVLMSISSNQFVIHSVKSLIHAGGLIWRLGLVLAGRTWSTSTGSSVPAALSGYKKSASAGSSILATSSWYNKSVSSSWYSAAPKCGLAAGLWTGSLLLFASSSASSRCSIGLAWMKGLRWLKCTTCFLRMIRWCSCLHDVKESAELFEEVRLEVALVSV